MKNKKKEKGKRKKEKKIDFFIVKQTHPKHLNHCFFFKKPHYRKYKKTNNMGFSL
jgi:hypothetical protein